MVNGSSDQRIDLLATPDPILVIFATSVDVLVRRKSHWNRLCFTSRWLEWQKPWKVWPHLLFSSKQCNKIKGGSIFEVERYAFNIWISIVWQTSFKEIFSQWRKYQFIISRINLSQVLATLFNSNSMRWDKALSALRKTPIDKIKTCWWLHNRVFPDAKTVLRRILSCDC